MTPLEPGTRCECASEECRKAVPWDGTKDQIFAHQGGTVRACTEDTVRLVTVRDEEALASATGWLNEVSNNLNRGIGGSRAEEKAAMHAVTVERKGKQVPLCAPCADFHERGSK